jgi:hypothetical protein
LRLRWYPTRVSHEPIHAPCSTICLFVLERHRSYKAVGPIHSTSDLCSIIVSNETLTHPSIRPPCCTSAPTKRPRNRPQANGHWNRRSSPPSRRRFPTRRWRGHLQDTAFSVPAFGRQAMLCFRFDGCQHEEGRESRLEATGKTTRARKQMPSPTLPSATYVTVTKPAAFDSCWELASDSLCSSVRHPGPCPRMWLPFRTRSAVVKFIYHALHRVGRKGPGLMESGYTASCRHL